MKFVSYLPSCDICKNQQRLLRQLTIGDRTIRRNKPLYSLHFKQLRRYPTNPRTLGEHLRKKRIDMQLSMSELAELLGLGLTDSAIAKWEKN
jgi:hypothetical protein